MATLIKRPDSRFFIACFDVPQPDGTVRRLKRSTKRSKRSEAAVEAMRLEETATKGAVSTGEAASRSFAILSEAAASAAKGELSEGRARELLGRLCEVSTGEPLRCYTVRTWADDWLAVKSAVGKTSTMACYRKHVSDFLAWLGDKADGRLESITKADVRAFRDAILNGWRKASGKPKLTKKGKLRSVAGGRRTASSANHHAASISAMFRRAMRDGLLLTNPCAALEHLPEDDSMQREVFTVAEVGRMVKAAGDPAWQDAMFPSGRADTATRDARGEDWVGMILVGFYAGARIQDCAMLTWANVNLSRCTLSFMPSKTSRKRKVLEVPLHPRLVAYLTPRARGAAKDGPLFPVLFKVNGQGAQGLSAQFAAIMESARIDRHTKRAGVAGGPRAQHARSFHALRHSLTSTLANLDVSEEIRRRIVGHESAEIHAGYTHHERSTLQRAVDKMPSV